jgi:hypothetical protein
MANKIYGTITNEANHDEPVAGLRVTAWDDDWPDGDDFLGETTTNSKGQYELTYADAFWDPKIEGFDSWRPDIYIITEIRNKSRRWVRLGKSQVYKDHDLRQDLQIDLGVNIQPLQTKMLAFDPTQYGFHFANNFKLEPDILGIDLGSWEMGFCGGMSSGARYRFMKKEMTPPDRQTPADDTPLFEELFKRQLKSTPPNLLVTLYDWQSAPSVSSFWRKPSLANRTKDEWPKLKRELDAGRPAVLILIRAYGYFDNPTKNHQVLAIGYEYQHATKDLVIYTYDPNVIDVVSTLSMSLGLPGGSLYLKDSAAKTTRGFMVNPYGKSASK